jgi:hypothetical protein
MDLRDLGAAASDKSDASSAYPVIVPRSSQSLHAQSMACWVTACTWIRPVQGGRARAMHLTDVLQGCTIVQDDAASTTSLVNAARRVAGAEASAPSGTR